jgi:AraC-like DNA-binding protein
LAYLVVESVQNSVIFHLLLVGPFLLPMALWMLSKSLFNDDVLQRKLLFGIAAAVLVVNYLINYWGHTMPGLRAVVGKVVALVFVVLALMESQRGKADDLDETRLQWRRYFIYLIGSVVFLTLIAELGLKKESQLAFQSLQRVIILSINTLFLVLNYRHHSHLLSKPNKKPEVVNHALVDRIQNIMNVECLYRQEKLSIGELADKLQVQEYKLRQTINQELAYRNFLDFLNSYRINEATVLLKDASKKDLTVQEICYQVGFNSLGPFNRAFKDTTDTTPSAYRKKHLM